MSFSMREDSSLTTVGLGALNGILGGPPPNYVFGLGGINCFYAGGCYTTYAGGVEVSTASGSLF